MANPNITNLACIPQTVQAATNAAQHSRNQRMGINRALSMTWLFVTIKQLDSRKISAAQNVAGHSICLDNHYEVLTMAELPILDKVKSGAAAAGLVGAITGALTNWLPGAEGLADPINMIVDALLTGALSWLAAFLGGYAKTENAANVTPK